MHKKEWPKFYNNLELKQIDQDKIDSDFENSIKPLLIKHNQTHFVDYYSSLSDFQEKFQFLNEIKRIDFDIVTKLKQNLLDTPEKTNEPNFRPIQQNIMTKKDRTCEQDQKAWQVGLDLIAEGKTAICLLAGGQASRLKFEHPKGMFNAELLSNTSIFELFVSKIKSLGKFARENSKTMSKSFMDNREHEIPILIMGSLDNFDEIKEFFEKHEYFGYKSIVLFGQTMQPSIDTNGQILLKSKTKIAFNPNGNGGIYQTLDNYGLVDLLKNIGVDYVHISGIDNILAKLDDPMFIGYTHLRELDVQCKYSQRKNAQEAVGVHALVDNKPNVIEYMVIGKQEAEKLDSNGELYWNYAHLVNFVITSKALEHILNSKDEISHLYNVALKAINKYCPQKKELEMAKDPNGYKFELFIFQGFSVIKEEKFGLLEIDRDDEFAPIKNHDEKGVDCPKTARELYYKYHKKILEKYGVNFEISDPANNVECEISPNLSYDGEGLKQQLESRGLLAEKVKLPFYLN